jgi:hypothetical protein
MLQLPASDRGLLLRQLLFEMNRQSLLRTYEDDEGGLLQCFSPISSVKDHAGGSSRQIGCLERGSFLAPWLILVVAVVFFRKIGVLVIKSSRYSS